MFTNLPTDEFVQFSLHVILINPFIYKLGEAEPVHPEVSDGRTASVPDDTVDVRSAVRMVTATQTKTSTPLFWVLVPEPTLGMARFSETPASSDESVLRQDAEHQHQKNHVFYLEFEDLSNPNTMLR
jgi:hypothetical protein